MNMNMEIDMNISIIGYKNHALRLISIINKLGVCSKLTIYHPNKEKIHSFSDYSQFNFKVIITSVFDDVYQSECVFIASPTSTHYDYLTKLLKKYDGYIFCEKPPALNLDENTKISLLSKKDKERIYFNFNYRFSALSCICKDAIGNGMYGPLISMQFNSGHGLACQPSYKNNWRNTSSLHLENIVGNVGVHYIDLVQYLLGPIDDIHINKINISKYSKHIDTVLIQIPFNDILPASIYLSYSSPFVNSSIVTFSDAIICLDNGCLTIQTPRDSFDENGMSVPAKKREIVSFSSSREYYNDALVCSVENFINSVKLKNKFDTKDFDSALNSTLKVLNSQC